MAASSRHPTFVRSRAGKTTTDCVLSTSPAGFPFGLSLGLSYRFPFGLSFDQFLLGRGLPFCRSLLLVSSEFLLVSSQPLLVCGELLLQSTNLSCTFFLYRCQFFPQRGLFFLGFLPDLGDGSCLFSRCLFLLRFLPRRLPFYTPSHIYLLIGSTPQPLFDFLRIADSQRDDGDSPATPLNCSRRAEFAIQSALEYTKRNSLAPLDSVESIFLSDNAKTTRYGRCLAITFDGASKATHLQWTNRAAPFAVHFPASCHLIHTVRHSVG